MKSFAALLVTLAVASNAAARTFTVYNACPFTIWSIFTGVGATPSHPTGWQAAPFTAVSFNVPDNWTAGRIWARRNCNFGSNPGPNSCLTGGCNGGLACTNPGVPPATLAEFTLSGANNLDFYDVSLVDGYNLPIRINNNKGCPITDCPVDLGPNCPEPLKGPFDSVGFPVGCKSACIANLDGNPGNSRNCCSGQFNTPQTCPASGVQFYSYFKNACPKAYAYAYDDSSSTFTCNAGLRADYTVTFCP
ncbi:thaumatin-like protein [Coprinopsis marcescibilis]|uniref:Thaumatin-like protein n=1 Tax=Coprinopsis marcescibilis TaxID=230819 RepID=A0A5C3KHL0_COPMA|nr:thaumatin-like protein [Coprinopsis marcescibilis]